MNTIPPYELTQEKVYAVREEFFTAMEKVWREGPTRIDVVMGQSKFFIPPERVTGTGDWNGAERGKTGAGNDGELGHEDLLPFSLQGERIHDVAKGLLMQSFLTSVEGTGGQGGKGGKPQTLRFFYSLFQAGDWLRFGILIRGQAGQEARGAGNLLNAQRQRELEKIWDRPADVVSRGEDGLLLEWRFVEPEFYTNFAVRERFIQIARHLHFRLGWVVYNYLNEDEGDGAGDKAGSKTGGKAEDWFDGVGSTGAGLDTMDGADGGRLQVFLEETK